MVGPKTVSLHFLFIAIFVEEMKVVCNPLNAPANNIKLQARNDIFDNVRIMANDIKKSKWNHFTVSPKSDHPFLKLGQEHFKKAQEKSNSNWHNTKQPDLAVEINKNFQMSSENFIHPSHYGSVDVGVAMESLTREDVRDNYFLGRSNNYGPCKVEQNIADCSNLNLDSVPQGLPRNIISLDLSGNNLNSNSLTDGPFKLYSQLTSLFLDSNNISSLPDQSFIGLDNLVKLGLYNNSIIMDKALNQSGAFVPLNKSLRRLFLNNNTKNVNMPTLDYPDKALSYLTNLEVLQIDGLPNKALGFHFKQMTKLRGLSFEGFKTGQCNLSYLHNDTFVNVPAIQFLIISACGIRKARIDKGVLEPLKNLTNLDISYNFELGLDGLGKIMYGQRNNQNLKWISMMYIVQRYEPCIVLYKEMLQNFRNLSIEKIDAAHNNIEMIEYDAVEFLPETLIILNLTGNNIMFGAYWEHLKHMISLRYLYLNGYDEPYMLPLSVPSKNIHCPAHREGGGHYQRIETNERNYEYGPLTLHLPPKLVNITMKSYDLSYKIDTIVFNSTNSLKSVNLHGNNFPRLNGPIHGLNKLKHLDFSSCSVSEISNTFFSSFKSLRSVNLYGNLLGENLAKQSARLKSSSLEVINFGSNNIFKLHKNLLSGCPSLKTLILSDNRLTDVSSLFDKLPNLQKLFLTRNGIHTLPKAMRDHFENLKGRAFIDMTFNPIDCNCDNIQFLEWVTRTNIFGENYTNYYCNYPGERYVSQKQMDHGYDEELKLLINECANNTKLLICVTSATVAFFIILISVIIYRFRWNMRYWYYMAKVMLTNKPQNTSIEDFQYDAFVCYCHHDNNFITEELEIKLGQERNLKLLLHDKCFQAGQEIAESILMAVRQSRKTVVVLSKAMLDSSWCNYGLEMARQESISACRNVLVILFLESVPKASMSLDILNYIRSNVVVTYPAGNSELQEEFWDRLARDLQSP